MRLEIRRSILTGRWHVFATYRGCEAFSARDTRGEAILAAILHAHAASMSY